MTVLLNIITITITTITQGCSISFLPSSPIRILSDKDHLQCSVLACLGRGWCVCETQRMCGDSQPVRWGSWTWPPTESTCQHRLSEPWSAARRLHTCHSQPHLSSQYLLRLPAVWIWLPVWWLKGCMHKNVTNTVTRRGSAGEWRRSTCWKVIWLSYP